MNDIFAKHDCFAEKASIPSRLAWGDPGRCPDPCVSVVMPVYKRPDYFAQALRSVLDQDFDRPYEVVVVDNDPDEHGPNQRVVAEAASDKVLYYRNQENLGMYGNWNRGVFLARAPLVTFCHDDDLLLPGALRRLMALQRQHGRQCILSAYDIIDELGKKTGTTAYRRRTLLMKPRSWCRYNRFLQLMGNISCGDGSLYGRTELIETGGFDQRLYPVADYALNVAYSHHFGGIVNNVPTSCYRVAVNESMKIYAQTPTLFADKTRVAIHGRLLREISFPRRWAARFVALLYKNSLQSIGDVWTHAVPEAEGLRLTERLAMRIALNVSRSMRYQWRWAASGNFPEETCDQTPGGGQ